MAYPFGLEKEAYRPPPPTTEKNISLVRLGEKWETPLNMLWEQAWKNRAIWCKERWTCCC